MAEDELSTLAGRHGVATRYTDWSGEEVEVPRETLSAVLSALGVDASSPAAVREELARAPAPARPYGDRRSMLPPVVVLRRGVPAPFVRARPDEPLDLGVELASGETVPFVQDDVPLGWHRLHARQGGRHETAPLLVAPRALEPPPRMWGFTAQLYSVRSRASWGMGDLRDLADLAVWSAQELGAGFTLINPLHAAEPVPPVGASPYSPMSRRFAAPIYLRVEDLPEYGALPAADRERLAALAAPLRPARDRIDRAEPLIDRDRVWTAKLKALELLYGVPRDAETTRRYEDFRRREGEALTAFATWCALAEEHGADWRRWPAGLRDARSRAVAEAAERLAGRVDFHAWLQWRLDGQLGDAQRAAKDAGMPVGIVHDLAVGVAHGGADAWIYRDLMAPGMSVGAPPDEFNQRGQDWGQPPWHPRRLADAAYVPFREMLAAVFRHGGGLRLDHAMQVSRLWWIPEGGSPADGTYVGYDRNALLGCLTWEAARAGAVVVGEDLGTVEPEVRDDLAARGILGTSLLWFEQDGQGHPKPPDRWRELSLATVGTHDMPPITGYLHGDHTALRERLGLLTRPAADEEDEHRRRLAHWLHLLHDHDLLPAAPEEIGRALAGGSSAYDEQVVAALHAFLARTPARLVGVSLADAVGERRTQNQPGTVDEYPNWRVPLADADGTPVLLDDLRANPQVRATLRTTLRTILRTLLRGLPVSRASR